MLECLTERPLAILVVIKRAEPVAGEERRLRGDIRRGTGPYGLGSPGGGCGKPLEAVPQTPGIELRDRKGPDTARGATGPAGQLRAGLCGRPGHHGIDERNQPPVASLDGHPISVRPLEKVC